jgi:hypothetical protein
VRRPSTKVNAVFAIQAQTAHDGIEFADLFVVEPRREVVELAWKAEYSPQDVGPPCDQACELE